MPVVEVAAVASRLGLDAAALTPAQTAQITSKIDDSAGKVEGELNRSLTVVEETLTDLYPIPGYDHTDIDAWPGQGNLYPDYYEVVTVVAAASGEPSLFDVTFKVGVDLTDPQYRTIVRFILQDAEEALRQDPVFSLALGGRKVSTVSADGQSIKYETSGGTETVGGQLTLKSLRRWKRSAVYQRPSRPLAPWPLG